MPAIQAAATLAHLKVLDLTRARSGPTAARQFADWGADVIKIEPPDDNGEDMGHRNGADFQNLHRNKRSITINLKKPEGRALFYRMVSTADVVLENFRPDVKHRLGVDFETLRAHNKRLVYGSISGFGQDGPYAARPGVDQVIQGMGGHMSITGEPGRGPMRSGAALSDMFAGILCANAVLSALLEREQSGEGQWVQTSLLEAQIFMLDFQAVRWLVKHDKPGQDGNNHAQLTPMGVFMASDGYLNIAPLARMWKKFCEALGADAIASNPDYATRELRNKNRTALNAAIQHVVVQHDRKYWVDAFNAVGVPCGPVYSVDETFADPQVQHLGIAQSVEVPALGRTQLLGQPIHMSRAKHAIVAGTPGHGQHTDEILLDLGYAQSEIDELRAHAIV